MSEFEILLIAGTVAAAMVGIGYVIHLLRTCGRVRPRDPSRVGAMIKAAPMDRFLIVMKK